MDVLSQLNDVLAGRDEILRELGAGGMATVYLARDVRHERQVALKVLKPELGAILGADRFLAEIQGQELSEERVRHPMHRLPHQWCGESLVTLPRWRATCNSNRH